MSKKYTPTTDQVENAYIRFMRNAFIASEGEHREEFRRWMGQEYEKAYQQGCRDTLGVSK